jgi:glycosyltransferase involved in cell wall biosynthesis
MSQIESLATDSAKIDADVPGVAMISNVLTPYRENLHREIAERIPELKIHTLITHGPADFDWGMDSPASIHVKFFGGRDDSPLAGTFRKPISEWQKGGRLIQYLRQNRIKAVVMLGYRYISYLRTIRYCNAAGIPLFVNSDSNIHGDRWLSSHKRWLKKRLYAWWLHRVTGVMSMGEFGDQFFTYYGAKPDQIYRVPYWPDYDAFSRIDHDHLNRFRRKYGLSTDRHYILYSGRFVPQKRVDLLIDAYASIAAGRPNWDLLVVGEGALRPSLQQRIPTTLQSRVVWTGFLEGIDLRSAYHASDLMVLPSEREPWALVVQEAMAAGLPVIASDIVGAAHELVNDKISGRIFRSGDCTSLQSALRDVTDPTHLAKYKEQTKKALIRYREEVDPVREIRRALVDAGILPS